MELHTNWVAVCLLKSLQGNFRCAKVRLREWMGESQRGRMDESCNLTLHVTEKIVELCLLTDLSMISSSVYECICRGLVPEEE